MRQSKFAPVACFSPGYVANAQEGILSKCRFGGCAWATMGPREDLERPVLLITIDLDDPLLMKSIASDSSWEIPLCSYINLDGMIPIQEYSIDQESRKVIFKPFNSNVKSLKKEHRLVTPLPQSFLRLRELRDIEKVVNNESYWVAMDSFLGGTGAIRLCGAPLYIDDYEEKDDFRYIASIGYESPEHVSGLLPNEAFFLGEMAHYFFVSKDWQTVRVVTQAT